MALIVVGGQAKDIGKTTLVCNILAAFPQFSWMAVKLTTHRHRPIDCELVAELEGASLWRQTHPGPDSDTARFLRAGAKEAMLIEASTLSLNRAWVAFLGRGPRQSHLIVESTAASDFLTPALFLLLIDASDGKDGKKVSDQLKRAHAVLSRNGKSDASSSLKELVNGKPWFEAKKDVLDLRLQSLIADVLKESA